MRTNIEEHTERLIERFNKSHLESFDDRELLELVLSFTTSSRNKKRFSRTLVNQFGDARGVFDASLDDLKSVKGIGGDAAVMLKLFKEGAKYYLRSKVMSKSVIASQRDVSNYLMLNFSGERIEKFLALFLNSKGELLSVDTLHEGTIDRTDVCPRKVVESALKCNARSVIFAHNHPSGNPTPSKADYRLTMHLVKMVSFFDIIVHDHLIVGNGSYFSAKEEGWIGESEKLNLYLNCP